MSTPATSVTPAFLDELITHEQMSARWYWRWLYASAAAAAALVVAVHRPGAPSWSDLLAPAIALVAPGSLAAAFFRHREKICGLQLLKRHLQAVAQDTEECQRVSTLAWGVVQKMLGE